MPDTYDLAVAYRICPKLAQPALGLAKDKLQLADCCLGSFRDALGGLRAKIWVLLDDCPPAYEKLFRKYFDERQLVLLPFDGIGNMATFGKQIDILLNQSDTELIYFAEDDYFYLPGIFSRLTDFLLRNADVDFVTPYDHPDCYSLVLHRQPKWLRVYADHHWRTAASTCLTFLTTKKKLRKTRRIFRSYQRGNSDASLWLSLSKQGIWNPVTFTGNAVKDKWLTKIVVKAWLYGWRQIIFGERYRLWAPVPGFATHMDARALSPAIDWKRIMQLESPAIWSETLLVART